MENIMKKDIFISYKNDGEGKEKPVHILYVLLHAFGTFQVKRGNKASVCEKEVFQP